MISNILKITGVNLRIGACYQPMPTVPIRQRLLGGALQYARLLQHLRRRTKKARDEDMSSDSESSSSEMDVEQPGPVAENNNDVKISGNG